MNGINYYHESMGYLPKTYKSVVEDILLIKEKFDSIKLYHNPFKVPQIIDIAQIAKIAKENGLYVVWAENNDTDTLTEENWGDYCDLVKQDGVIAKKLGVDEFLVGNEISIHNDNSVGFNDVNLPLKIKSLVEECQFTQGMIISCQEGWWKKESWETARLENLPKIHFTLYETEEDFETNAKDILNKFGKSAEIGEWSTQSTFLESATDEIDWAKKILDRRIILQKLGLNNYYFCFRDTGVDNNDKGFGLWKNTIKQPHLIWTLL